MLRSFALPHEQHLVEQRTEDALLSEFSELRRSFVIALREMLTRSTSMLFPDLNPSTPPLCAIERELLRHVRMRVVDRAGTEPALRDALRALVRERAEAKVREAYAQALLHAKRDACEVRERLRAAALAADVDRVVRNILSPEPRVRIETPRLNLDLDLRKKP